MMRYETLFLTVPEVTNDEASTLEKQFDELVKKSKGVLISFERWGKYRLAYPVANNEYGVYFLVRFEVERDKKGDLLDEIKSFFKLKHSDLVKRNMTSVLDAKKSLAYQRPESLEEAPHDVDDFLRKNKMEGLLPRHKKMVAGKPGAAQSDDDDDDQEQQPVAGKKSEECREQETARGDDESAPEQE